MRRGSARAMAPAEPTVSAGAVTDLAPSSRRPGRWDVSVDGRVVGAVSLELVERVGLRVGRVLDDAAAALVADGIAEVSVYDRALAMLAARARSSRDLRQRLVRAGAAPAPVDAAVARLEASQLLDDAAYARQVARSRVATRGDSRRRVTQALAQAGVARDTADEAVADVFVDEAVDEVALVEQAARKRARTLGALAPEVRRRRLYGYLARRGHDASLIRAVVDRVLGGDSSEASVDGTEDDEA